MGSVEGVIFDMDDTLYLEQEYVLSGFRAVAKFLAVHGGGRAEALYAHMTETFRHGNRRAVFDDVLATWPQLRLQTSVDDLIQIYRAHYPSIQLLPGIVDMLEDMRGKGTQIGLISDGFLIAQQTKFRALSIEHLFDLVVFTDSWGREYWKPHPRAFEATAAALSIPGSKLVYVGDNPFKDFTAPSELGWRTVRLRFPGQLHMDHEASEGAVDAQHECTSVHELAEMLNEWA